MATWLDPAWKWTLLFCVVDFANRIVFGAFGTMLFPAQPYLAGRLGCSIEAVTAIWSLGKVECFDISVK